MDINTTTLHLVDGLHFTGRTATGHHLDLDSPLEGDEPGAGPSPMQLQLLALGGCGAMDTISILRKMRQDVTGYDLRLTHERATDHPRVFTSIAITHVLKGQGLAEAMVRRAIGLTMSKYCPVYAMLHPSVDIRERYEITDDGTGETIAGEVTLDDAKADSKA